MMELLKAFGTVLLILLLVALFVLILTRWHAIKHQFTVSRCNGARLLPSVYGALLFALLIGNASGESVQRVKLAPDESFWHYLAQWPGGFDAQVFYALLFSGVVGIAGHYLRQWMNKEIEGSLIDYLFVQYPRRTMLAVGTYIGWIIGLVGTGAFITNSGEFVGWGLVLILGLTNGYGVDSLANRGSKSQGDAK